LNIKAKFGRKQTSQLLDDQIKVHDTLSKILNRGSFRKVSKLNINESDKIEKNEYYELGAYLRHSFCHGNPKTIRKSTTSLAHNSTQSKDFFSDRENFDSPYRRKKDWLSRIISNYNLTL
jgi:hypothetical protein